MKINWINITDLESRDFICGYCGSDIASNKGYSGHAETSSSILSWSYYCHRCGKLNFFDPDGTQYPGSKFGAEIQDISDEAVKDLYDEARKCYSANAFTASVMCCRKLLMNIAVAKGDKVGKTFVQYIKYLDEYHYTPPDSTEWVKHIKDQGNQANHQIEMKSQDDAKDLITFLEMLLKFNYEFHKKLQKNQQVRSKKKVKINEMVREN